MIPWDRNLRYLEKGSQNREDDFPLEAEGNPRLPEEKETEAEGRPRDRNDPPLLR